MEQELTIINAMIAVIPNSLFILTLLGIGILTFHTYSQYRIQAIFSRRKPDFITVEIYCKISRHTSTNPHRLQ